MRALFPVLALALLATGCHAVPGTASRLAAQGLAARADDDRPGHGIDDPYIVMADPAPAADVRLVPMGTEPNHWFPSGVYPALRYRLEDGRSSLDVSLPADPKALGMDRAKLLARITACYGLIPPANRDALRVFELDPGDAPGDEENRKKYGWPPDVGAAALTVAGRTTFFRGGKWLNRENFQHEAGHNVAWAQAAGCWYAPPGWPAARDGDATSLGKYADSNDAEDFATAYRAFLESRLAGGELAQRFRATYPRRAALLTTIAAGEQLAAAPCERAQPEAAPPLAVKLR